MNIQPSLSDFLKLSKKANVIPVFGELLADLDTPVSAFMKLDDKDFSFLLESVEGEEKIARFSFIGSNPKLLFKSHKKEIEITERTDSGKIVVKRYSAKKDPIAEIENMMRSFRTVPMPGLPRFYGGLVGYIGYDAVRFFENIPAHKNEPIMMPDIMLMLANTMVIFDHSSHKMLLISNAFLKKGSSPKQAYYKCISQIKEMARSLKKPMKHPIRKTSQKVAKVRSNTTKKEFFTMVQKAKEHIKCGDIIQAVLSQRFQLKVKCTPLDAYRTLRSINPSPYMYLLRFGPDSLIGSSPEMLVRCEEGNIETRPIAGTRKRGRSEQEDQVLIHQLLQSPKERAEHIMLVDLGRNDLGRVARTGSVSIPELMKIEKYSHVMHLVSSVRAKLAKGKNSFDVLRASFPAGTVSGAPKIRAMEIIAALEKDSRGTYAGAVGYISFSGNMDTCITIRTILMRKDKAFIQAGAGIVADSNPLREYQETANKAKSCLRAIEIAHRGLDID